MLFQGVDRQVMKRLVITDYNINNTSAKLSMLFEDNREIRIGIYDNEESVLGNIYVARVRDIVRNIDAAFVEIAPGKVCYFSMKDNQHPIFLNRKNTDKVCQGDLIMVQVMKDGIKTKAPLVSGVISFSGKYAAITREQAMRVGISHKINDKEVSDRLKAQAMQYVTEDYGFIIRTDAVSASKEELDAEFSKLSEEYTELVEKAHHRPAFTLLKSADNGICRDISDYRLTKEDEIITDDKELADILAKQGYEADIRLYDDKLLPLIKAYSMESRLEHALDKRVWLKSGGYLVIEPTEALTVIDVNTGKFDGRNADREKTFLKTNLEACAEIARQLILRNISGIIIIDFINLGEKENRNVIQDTMKKYLAADPVKAVFVEFTGLDLMEITRKKIKKPLYEIVKGEKNA